jgi:hypothetical protein
MQLCDVAGYGKSLKYYICKEKVECTVLMFLLACCD